MTTPNTAVTKLSASRQEAVERVVYQMAMAFYVGHAWAFQRIKTVMDYPEYRVKASERHEFFSHELGDSDVWIDHGEWFKARLPDATNLVGLGLITHLSVVAAMLSLKKEFRDRYRAGADAMLMMAASDDMAAKLMYPLCRAVTVYHGELPPLKGDW